MAGTVAVVGTAGLMTAVAENASLDVLVVVPWSAEPCVEPTSG